MKTLRFFVMAFAAFTVLKAAPSEAATVCTGKNLKPFTDSQYLNGCFVLNLELDLDFKEGTFTQSGGYNRLKCGGWPPEYQPISGVIQETALGRYELVGHYEGSSTNDFVAHAAIQGNVLVLSFESNEVELVCQ